MTKSQGFQTIVETPEFRWKGGYEKLHLFIGSCFTENVGHKMAELKYPVDINPFGILYNPVSVAHALRFLLKKETFSENELIHHDGLWHSFFHHSRFSSPDKQKALSAINSRLETSAQMLQKADFLFITFGTAWVYEYKPTGQTVSNCHKIPGKLFHRYRLTGGEIVEEFRILIGEIWKINPKLKIVFTVSPIRHWKDGAVENQRSKATLILAIDQLIRGFGNKRCAYFPAYEIVMDELRDYRFYSEDMIHLSPLAVNHIWEKFAESLIDPKSREISGEVQKVVNAMNHKPFNRLTKEYLLFLEQSLLKTQTLQKNFSYLNLTFEENYFLEQIDKISHELPQI